MRHIKSLSCFLTVAVVGLSLTAPAIASATTDSDLPGAADAIAAAQVPDPVIEAQGSDHQKDNRTWRKLKVDWDWSMPDGIPATNDEYIPQTPMGAVPGYPQAGNALYGPLPDGADPEYQVVLDPTGTHLKKRKKGLRCEFSIQAAGDEVTVGPSPCKKTESVGLPEGTWPLTLTVTDRRSGVSKTVTSEIEVLNVLFAVTGDSYSAGEGYPPFTTTVNGKTYIQWDEPGCDRSRWSGFVRAAAMAEQSDPHSNVTLVDVACSGSQILEQDDNPGVSQSGGMLAPKKIIIQGGKANPLPASLQSSQYSGDPANPGYWPAQIDQLDAVAQGKTYDVHLFSIGGNDSGLAPIVEDCLAFDVLPVAMNKILMNVENTLAEGTPAGPWPSGMALAPSCYTNGQVDADLADLSNVTDASVFCVNNTIKKFAPQDATAQQIRFWELEQALVGCQWVPQNDDEQDPQNLYKPLWQVADDNLNILTVNMARLAPCLGADVAPVASAGAAPVPTTCETKKLVNGTPADVFTASDPVKVNSMDDVAQAMYPDLTQKATARGTTEACSVQQDPTKPWGGELELGAGSNPVDPSTWTFKLGPNPLDNPPWSPANQVDNTWLYGHLYEGVAGRPVGVPQPGDYPNNVPVLFKPSDDDQQQGSYAAGLGQLLLAGVLPDSNQPAPSQDWTWTFQEPVVPTADGLVTQMNTWDEQYGWRVGMSMYNDSHPHGLCATNRWVTNLYDFAVNTVLYNGTGYGLHPNEDGYQAYGGMLGPMAIDMAGLPVVKAADSVEPLGNGVPTKTKVRAPRAVNSGGGVTIAIKVTGEVQARSARVPGLRGRVEVRGNKKGNSHWSKKIVKIKANGKRKYTLPKNWTRLAHRSSGNLRVQVRYLGNPTFQSSKTRKFKIHLR